MIYFCWPLHLQSSGTDIALKCLDCLSIYSLLLGNKILFLQAISFAALQLISKLSLLEIDTHLYPKYWKNTVCCKTYLDGLFGISGDVLEVPM